MLYPRLNNIIIIKNKIPFVSIRPPKPQILAPNAFPESKATYQSRRHLAYCSSDLPSAMNSLIRKLWVSVTHRSCSPSGSGRVSSPNLFSEPASSTGEFDRIPFDILMQIVKILGPKESAKLRAVCRSWKFLLSDNRLWIYFLQNQPEPWDSVFFAETHLRSGYPLQAFPAQMHDLSFMQIFGQREEVPGALIIDGGSGYCKYGWSKYSSPSGRSATFLEFGNIESPMSSKLRNFYATICSSSRRQLKDAIYSTLFEMNVPAVCAINQATLALFAARRTSGIVVNVGFNQTSVVPILHGKVMHKVGVEVVGMGALKLTGFLRDRLQQNNIQFDSLYTVRTLKENLCYVALDYEAELSKDTEASYAVSSDTQFTLSKERFQTGEILFQPRMAGMQAMGLHQAVGLCMDHCHDAELSGDNNWYKTVVLAGGTACLPGLAGRLEKELYGLLPASMSGGIRVIPPPYGTDSAWFGAKLVSNLSTFPSWCMTKKQFRLLSKRKLTW
ncbi:actin-related family protein [Striga asiatica]|uniref:Actin-related family protein n=1 Tax=Striga asiatica TaxID=4170 RepID=A0A5A7R5H7_STRAF|nr:actin-related family protein [Striga asiatica]